MTQTVQSTVIETEQLVDHFLPVYRLEGKWRELLTVRSQTDAQIQLLELPKMVQNVEMTKIVVVRLPVVM